MALEHTLIVHARAEQLLYRVYPRLVNFPKSETYGLSARIKEAFFDMLKFISMGAAVKSKRKMYLQEADGQLQTLKTLIRLSNHRKYIGQSFFREIDYELTEINKLLSGFIRSASA